MLHSIFTQRVRTNFAAQISIYKEEPPVTDLIMIIVYIVAVTSLLSYIKKKSMSVFKRGAGVQESDDLESSTQRHVKEASAQPHTHRAPGKYDTFNKKSLFNTQGAQPHIHETKKYSSMPDASKLPPGYILLNGEPVRVADLEGK